jgi:hypothetical protein
MADDHVHSEDMGILDNYKIKIQRYWKKSVDEQKMLSSDELKDLNMAQKALIERRGAGNDELVDKIKRIAYLNAVREEYKKEDELYKEYLLLSKNYRIACEKGCLNKEDEAKLVKQINDLAFVFSEH